MKKLMKTFLLLPLLMLMSLTIIQAEENEGGGTDTVDITLTYTMEGIRFHKLQVTVNGPGLVRDGDAVIRDGTNIYEIREDAEKVLLLEADEDSYLKSIEINGNKTESSQNRIILKELREDSEVMIRFERNRDSADTPNPEDPNHGQNIPGDVPGSQNKPEGSWNGSRPETGDVTKAGTFLILLAIAASIIVYIKRRKEASEGEK